MEAGYDYLLLRGKLQRNIFTFPAIFLVVLGALLLAGGGAYYGYAAKARADLGQLNVTAPVTRNSSPSQTPPERSGNPEISRAIGTNGAREGNEIEIALPPAISASAIAGQSLDQGDPRQLEALTNPLSYEPGDYRQRALLQGFTPMAANQAGPVGSLAGATRIIIPSIGLDSGVNELAIRDLGDSRAYETPVNSVGHIPQSANGGEANSSWFFGHLESPILGEGSVFYNLPQIAEQLRNGEEVNIITDNGVRQYLYRVAATEVVHQDDMQLSESGAATIHLVSCVPSLVYDHRLIVTGELIGVK